MTALGFALAHGCKIGMCNNPVDWSIRMAGQVSAQASDEMLEYSCMNTSIHLLPP